MRVSTSIVGDDLGGAGARALAAEQAGFDLVTSQENRHEPFMPLTLAAAATTTIGLATSVAIAFPRSPMVAASTAWDLQSLSGGRFVLGLGSQIKAHNVKRFSVGWSAPAPRMREYVQAIKAIFDCWQTGERLAFEGDHYQFSLMTPNFTPPPLDTAPPPIHISAVGPFMLGVAGRVCDGVMLHPFCTRTYLEDTIIPKIEQGLQASGRSRDDFEISGGGFVATGATNEEVDTAVEFARKRVGFYGSTPAYWPVFEAHGLDELGPKLNAMSKAGQWDAMTSEIDDDVLDLFCARGNHDEIGAAVADHFGGLVTTVGLDAATPGEVIEAIKSV